jgi:hypothetical protein
MVVDALERHAGGGEPLVDRGKRFVDVRLEEATMLADEVPHEDGAGAGRARRDLAAGRGSPVVREHLRNAASGDAVLERGQPEVPVLAALDELRVVAARELPHATAIEGADVDRAPAQHVRQREGPRLPRP